MNILHYIIFIFTIFTWIARTNNIAKMMRKILAVCLYCVFLIPNYGLSQTRDVLHNNLAPLFDNMTMIGVLGDDYSRIDIRFTSVKKVSDTVYTIIGASRTRMGVVCSFKGQITINSVDFRNRLKEEGTDIDGFLCGDYRFVKTGRIDYSGIFSGAFKQAFRLENGEVFDPVNDIVENRLNTAEYIGLWQMGNITKICNWSDAVIPDAVDDFCKFNDAGEWYASPKYRKRGWDNHYNAYFNDSISSSTVEAARKNEEVEWWKLDMIK